MKFGRSYYMSVTGNVSKSPHVFRYPQANGQDGGLTLKFNVTRHNLAGLNEGTFSLYNLAPATRQDLFYDPTAHPESMVVQAGYTSNASRSDIFNGQIFDSYPDRQHTEVIMRMRGLDGIWGTSNAQIPTGTILTSKTPLSQRAQKIMLLLKPYGIFVGKPNGLSEHDDVLSTEEERPTGLVWDWLQKNKPNGGDVFIDSGKVYFLSQNVPGPAPVGVTTITDELGLIDIPKKFGYRVSLSMVFEPSFLVGQSVGVNSTLAPWVFRPYPGYKVLSINHQGTISPVESGEATTMLELLASDAPVPVIA